MYSFVFLTIGIGGINEGFLFLLQLQDGWTDGTDSFHFNFRMDGPTGLDLSGQVWTGVDRLGRVWTELMGLPWGDGG